MSHTPHQWYHNTHCNLFRRKKHTHVWSQYRYLLLNKSWRPGWTYDMWHPSRTGVTLSEETNIIRKLSACSSILLKHIVSIQSTQIHVWFNWSWIKESCVISSSARTNVERLTISRHLTLCYQLSTLVCLVLFCCCLLHCDKMHLSPCVKPCVAKYFTRNKGNTATYLSHRRRSHGPPFDIRWS